MVNDILKTCKKYVIQMIVNPSLYWITECESEKCCEKEMKSFERLLSKQVVKFTDSEVLINTLVAVEENKEFFRGLVTDVFNRNSNITYSVLLIDYGKMIETTKDKIYYIKSQELINQKSKALAVSLHGIEPARLDINDITIYNGIFQKRKCNSWPTIAFKFVERLFEKNPQVFVKFISSNEKSLSGDIYFLQESDGMLISLGQKLCEEGFAVLCDLPKFITKHNPQDKKESGIEKKIPQTALFQDIQTFKNFGKIENSLNHSLVNTDIKNENTVSNTLSKSNPNSYSSSWILKKCQQNISSSSCDFKKQEICKSKQNKSSSFENSEVNLFRVAIRTMEHFEKHKQNPKKF